MKHLFTVLLLLSCSGEAFNEQRNSKTNSAGIGGESSETGGIPSEGGKLNLSGAGRTTGGANQAPSGGTPALAGGPSLGSAGGGGEGGTPDGGPATCLANWQNLDCARVCTNSQSDCQAVINCYVTSNSLDNCSNFTTVGISLAQDAERNCCHD